MAIPLRPSAYTSVSNPIRTYSSGESSKVVNGTNTYPYTFGINESGTLTSFLAVVNANSINATGGVITFNVYKNGTLITSSTIVADLYRTGANYLLFYETLSILSGTEVQTGDIFLLEVKTVTINGPVDINIAMTAVVISKGSSFYG